MAGWRRGGSGRCRKKTENLSHCVVLLARVERERDCSFGNSLGDMYVKLREEIESYVRNRQEQRKESNANDQRILFSTTE